MSSPNEAGVATVASLFTSEPLVAAGWDGRPIFKLAESVVESDDRRQLTVTLRPNVKFHSGNRVTAPVVRDLLVKQLERAPDIATIEALDDRRLRLTLHRPSTIKPEDLSPLIVDDEEAIDLRTGPYKLTSTEPTVLERFDEYYGGRPALQRIAVRRYTTLRAAWRGLMLHEVNFLHEVGRDLVEFVEAGGDIRAYPLLRPYYAALVFNQRHAVLQRRDVRIAINEAVDRNELVQNGLRGHGVGAEGPFWPYHWAYPHERFPVSFNPEAAKLRLDAAGLKVRPHADKRMPARFAFSCLTVQGFDRFERIALLVQRQLYAIGIDMKIVALPYQEFLTRVAGGDFDAFVLDAISGRTLTWAHRLWHSPRDGSAALMRSGYAAADAALERLQVARSDDEVRQAVADVMQVMRSDPPAAFLVWAREVRAADKSIDIPYEADRDVFGTLWQAKRASPALVAVK